MNTVIGQMVIDLRAEKAQLKRDLAKATAYNKNYSRKTMMLNKKVAKSYAFVARGVGLVAAAISARAITGGFKRTTQAMDDLNNASKKLGHSTTYLQQFRFAGEEVGVAITTTDMGLQRWIRRIGEAQAGLGELLPILKEKGIALTDSAGAARSAADILRDYADEIKNTANSQEQLRMAFKGFDSEGAALVSVLRDGATGLDDFSDKAHELGIIIKEETVKELAAMNRELQIAGTQWDSLTTIGAGNFNRGLEFVMGFGDQSKEDLISTPTAVLEVHQRRLEQTLARFKSEEATAGNSDSRTDFYQKEIVRIKKKLGLYKDILATRIKTNELPGDGGSLDKDPRANFDFKKDILNGLDTEVALLDRRASVLDLSTAAQDRAITAEKTYLDLLSRGIALTKEEQNQLDNILDMRQESADRVDELNKATAKALKEAEELQRATDDWTRTLNEGLSDAIFNAKSFGDVMEQLGKRLLNSALFGSDGLGGLLGGLLGGAGGFLSGIFGGARAEGGPVSSGKGYMVGERGREWFEPDTSGTIIPNHALAGMGGGGISIQQEIHFDLVPGPTVGAMIDAKLPAVRDAAIAGVSDAMARRGM